MNQEDILKMAREADCGHESMTLDWIAPNGLERFAALVAAKAAQDERQKYQADIERWKGEAAKAEKWRGLALARDGDGRTVQLVQQEAIAAFLERKRSDIGYR